MLILGVDTSGKHGSIALVRFESDSSEPEASNRKDREELPQSSQKAKSHTLEVVTLEGGTFSAQLVPQIAALLQRHGLTKHQIDGFAVVTGPGSFTGLRVGLAAIKALAEILRKPIAPVSLLEVLARSAVFVAAGQLPEEMKVFPYAVCIDAGRAELFVGIFEFAIPKNARTGKITCLSECLLTLDELLRLLGSQQIFWIATPDDALLSKLKERAVRPVVSGIFPLGHRRPPYAEAVARLGYERVQSGETLSPETLDATYIRRSEAEIKFAERAK